MLRPRLILSVLILAIMPPLFPQISGQDEIAPAVTGPGEKTVNAGFHLQDTLSVSKPEERESSLTAGADLVSSYIWRGSRQGRGPHIQPWLEYSAGRFTVGAWGTTDLNGYEEADLWFAVELPGGFTAGMQDYYLPELPYFNYSDTDGSHALELNLDWASDNVWLSANCIVNEAGGVGSYGRDLYFEAGLSFDYFSLCLGAGNGWHTAEGGFNVCNLGLEVVRDIPFSERFAIPFRAQLVFNPAREQLFVVAGFSIATGSGD